MDRMQELKFGGDVTSIIDNDEAACLTAARALESSCAYMSLDQFLMVLNDFDAPFHSVEHLMEWFCQNGYMEHDPECHEHFILTQWSEDNGWFCVGTEHLKFCIGCNIRTTTYYLSGVGQIYFLNLFVTRAVK